MDHKNCQSVLTWPELTLLECCWRTTLENLWQSKNNSVIIYVKNAKQVFESYLYRIQEAEGYALYTHTNMIWWRGTCWKIGSFKQCEKISFLTTIFFVVTFKFVSDNPLLNSLVWCMCDNTCVCVKHQEKLSVCVLLKP